MPSIASCLITGQIARCYTLTGEQPPTRKVPGLPKGYEPNPWSLRPHQLMVMRAIVKANGSRKDAVDHCHKSYSTIKTMFRICIAQMRVAGSEEALEAFREWDSLRALQGGEQ